MRETVADARPDLLALAAELVGADPFEHVADGTRFAQPAIYCAALAGWERLRAHDADFGGRPLAGRAGRARRRRTQSTTPTACASRSGAAR